MLLTISPSMVSFGPNLLRSSGASCSISLVVQSLAIQVLFALVFLLLRVPVVLQLQQQETLLHLQLFPIFSLQLLKHSHLHKIVFPHHKTIKTWYTQASNVHICNHDKLNLIEHVVKMDNTCSLFPFSWRL